MFGLATSLCSLVNLEQRMPQMSEGESQGHKHQSFSINWLRGTKQKYFQNGSEFYLKEENDL